MTLNTFFKKTAIALSIISALALPVSVSAETKTFEFSSSSVSGTYQNLAVGSKADEEPNWYITLNKKNGSAANTLGTNNRFECRISDDRRKSASTAHTFSTYVQRKHFSYTVDVYPRHRSTLKGRKWPNSTSTKTLKISGRFTP